MSMNRRRPLLSMSMEQGKIKYKPVELHPAERRLIQYLRELQFGEVNLKVQDGLPVIAERVREKVKFTETVDREE